jgi:hypothetical protein
MVNVAVSAAPMLALVELRVNEVGAPATLHVTEVEMSFATSGESPPVPAALPAS